MAYLYTERRNNRVLQYVLQVNEALRPRDNGKRHFLLEETMKTKSGIFGLIVLVSVPLFSAEYHVAADADNKVRFTSRASLESFSGTTRNIDGYVVWDDKEPLHNNEFYFEVPLETLDTGIGLRNRHMRDNYLQTDTYPLAKFTGKVVKYETVNDTTYSVSAEGKMTIHGVEKDLAVMGTLVMSGARIRIMIPFQLKLSDYRIKIPQFMFLKISEILDMEINLQMFKYVSQQESL
jgi:polyisoprenoid-binding protein YceI